MGNFSDSSAAFHFGRLQVSEPVSTANHSAPTEIKPKQQRQELHLLNAGNDLEGKRKDTFLSRIKGKKRWTCSWMDEFFKKGLYQTPPARGKHAVQPRFRNIQINCIPCSWRLGRTGRKVNSSPPPRLGAGKAEISPNYSQSPTEFSYIWLHKHVNTYYLTAFSSICSSLHSSTRLFPTTASLKGL